MGDKSKIEWTDATWNPVRGCSRVSEGCRNCYAEAVANRFCGPGSPYEGVVQIDADGKGLGKWNGQIKFVEKRLLDPLHWKQPRKIFVNSMSDVFHENVTDEMLDRIFAVMALCPQHTFQILTKRPERMLAYFFDDHGGRTWWRTRIMRWMVAISGDNEIGWPEVTFPNVWLGVSVENQKAADERLDYLCEMADRGWQTMVSFEPLLSAVDPGPWWLSLGQRTWAIVGGESGPGARPMHPHWAQSLRDQCVAAGVPFFFKQWGEWTPRENVTATTGKVRGADWVDGRWQYSTENLADEEGHVDDEPTVYRVGKRSAGNLLDGDRWQQFPAAGGTT